MFYTRGENIFILVDGTTTVTFTHEDVEGFYQAYLAWVAKGNTPEEWQTQ